MGGYAVEVAPATVRALLIPLAALLAWIIARGLIAAADAVVRGLFGTLSGAVGWIPFLNKVVQAPVLKIEQHLISALARAANYADTKIGAAFHALSQLVHRLAADVVAAAVFDWHLLRWVEAHVTQRNLVKLLDKYLLTTKYVRALVSGIAHALVKPIVGRIGALERWTYPKVRHALHEVDVAIPKDIAGLRARTRTLEDMYQAVWAKTKGIEARFGAKAFAGAVAVALTYLGLDWLRCSALGRLGRRFGCGGFGLLDELFAATFVGLAVTDICDFAAAAEAVAEEMVPLLMGLVDVEDALIGCHGATALPAFSIEPLHLPPTNLALPLAA